MTMMMTMVTPLIMPLLTMPAIVVPVLVITTVIVPVMMTLPATGWRGILPVTTLPLPALLITGAIIIVTGVIVAAATQYRPGGTTNPGTNHLTVLATHLATDGRATQATQCASQDCFILLAAMGGGCPTQRPTDGGTGQGTGIAAHLLSKDGPGHTTGTTANCRVEGLTGHDRCACQYAHQ